MTDSLNQLLTKVFVEQPGYTGYVNHVAGLVCTVLAGLHNALCIIPRLQPWASSHDVITDISGDVTDDVSDDVSDDISDDVISDIRSDGTAARGLSGVGKYAP